MKSKLLFCGIYIINFFSLSPFRILFSHSFYTTRAAKTYFENSAYFHTEIVCWIFHAENVNMNKLQVPTECIMYLCMCILECSNWKA